MAMHKPPAWLKPGSIVEVEIGKPGRLINPITEGPASDA
jgi:2,4-didehydro-3-deoxy-L-rhamnonate hydrolase